MYLHILINSLILLSLLRPAIVQAESRTYFVKSDITLSCPDERCNTLDNYVSNSTEYLTSDVTVVFLSGEHTLTQNINLTNVNNLALVRENATANVNISCQNVNILIHNSTNVTIEGLSFLSCGHSEDFNNGAVHFENIADLVIAHVLVRDCLYHGLTLINVFGSSQVENTEVHQSKQNGIPVFMISYQSYIPSNPLHLLPPQASNKLSLQNCRVSKAAALYVDLRYFGYSVDVDIVNFTANGIQGDPRGPLYISMLTPEENTVTVRDSRIINSDGTGLRIYDQGSSRSVVRIANCDISGHKSSGVYIQFYQRQPSSPTLEVVIEDTVVNRNAFSLTDGVVRGSGLTVLYTGEGKEYEQRSVVLRNVTFQNNNFTAVIGELPSIVHLSRAVNVTFIDCSFIGNQATALRAYLSVFTVAGNINMSHNFAFRGGALALFGSSYMIVENNTHILLHNNSASHVGGAVFVDSYYTPLLTTSTNCFMRIQPLEGLLMYASSVQVTLNFTDNIAESGGNAVYGARLQDCVLSTFYFGYQLLTGDLPIANFVPDAQSDISLVTSDPERVCLCTDEAIPKPDCFAIFFNETRYPGESFTVRAVVVGDNFGTVTGSVFARFLPSEGEARRSLSDLESTQLVSQEQCIDLRYTVRSGNDREVLTLTATGAPVLQYGDSDVVELAIDIYSLNGRILLDLLSSPVYINVTLLPCPVGFVLTEQSECDCDPTLVEHDIPCNISDQTIRRDGTIWIGVSFAGNRSDGVVVYRSCPYAYCVVETQNINLQEPNTQCVRNHAGTLCGGCKSGLSLTLGTSQCRPCTNDYLALLVLFMLAGVALVLFIKVLNLTVTKGTLNGLIFYANVIQASNTDFFPRGNTSVFIAWLNLDLGIETCFFDGLNGYSKTWLQFVFPIYIWVIAFVIIIASRRSPTMAKIFGTNSVPILTTLFHLSYAKLLRTVINSLSLTGLVYPDNSIKVVWTFDGNIDYLNSKHAPLFVVSLVVLLALWLPYTALLFLSQWLTKIPNHRISRWYTRIKPFLDAYFGPFKDKHRYWVGVLLLARCILFLAFEVFSDSSPAVDFLLIVVVTSLLLTYAACTCGLYKKWYKTWLENSFFLNLILLSTGNLYILRTGEGSIETLSYVSVGIAFAEFLLIIALHVYSYLHGRKLWELFLERVVRRTRIYGALDQRKIVVVANELVTHQTVTHQTVSLAELREPLLDDTS